MEESETKWPRNGFTKILVGATLILFTGIENYEQSLVKQNRRYIKHKATAMLKQNKVKLNQIPGTS